MSYPQSIIKRIYHNAPDIIADLIASEEMGRETGIISQKYHLQPNQKNLLGNELTLRLIGVTSGERFIQKIEIELKIDAEIAKQIASAVTDQILSKIPKDILTKQEEQAQLMLEEVSKLNEVETIRQKDKLDQEETVDRPVIITVENKEVALKQLDERVEQQKASVPEIASHNLPMVEPGETVHDAKPMTEVEGLVRGINPSNDAPQQQAWARKPWNASEQAYKYPGGKDPYREPLG